MDANDKPNDVRASDVPLVGETPTSARGTRALPGQEAGSPYPLRRNSPSNFAGADFYTRFGGGRSRFLSIFAVWFRRKSS
jgi:hypothetical protein